MNSICSGEISQSCEWRLVLRLELDDGDTKEVSEEGESLGAVNEVPVTLEMLFKVLLASQMALCLFRERRKTAHTIRSACARNPAAKAKRINAVEGRALPAEVRLRK